MSHNLINNIIPGAIAFVIIVGGIFWLIAADIREQAGKSPLRLRWRQPAKSKPARPVTAARASLDA
jgi:hypothetical protein